MVCPFLPSLTPSSLPLGPGCSVHPGLFFHVQQPIGTITLTQRTLPSPRRREEPGVRGEMASTYSRVSHTAPSSSQCFSNAPGMTGGVVCTSSSASGEVALEKRGRLRKGDSGGCGSRTGMWEVLPCDPAQKGSVSNITPI